MRRFARTLVALVALAAGGCEDPPRVPYIRPELAQWPPATPPTSVLQAHVFTTGRVGMPEVLLRRGGSPSVARELPAIAYVLEHPDRGWIVVGAGLDAESEPVAPPGGGVLGGLLSGSVEPSRSLAEQMDDAGLEPAAVRLVVLPTLRPEHAGGVEAFPQAEIIVSAVERRHAAASPGYRKSDFDGIENWREIEFGSTGLGTFPASVDLLADGSVVVIEAGGWTPGSMIVLVRLRGRPVLLASALALIDEHARYAAKPTAVFDFDRWWQRIWELKRFADLEPDLVVVSGDGPQAWAAAQPDAVVVHAAPSLPDPDTRPTPDALRRLLPQ